MATEEGRCYVCGCCTRVVGGVCSSGAVYSQTKPGNIAAGLAAAAVRQQQQKAAAAHEKVRGGDGGTAGGKRLRRQPYPTVLFAVA